VVAGPAFCDACVATAVPGLAGRESEAVAQHALTQRPDPIGVRNKPVGELLGT
jgi:hypothetical protein